MKYILSFITLLIIPVTMLLAATSPNWRNYPEQNKWSSEKNYYSDILNRLKTTPKYYGDRNTDAHESCHFVHSQLRNDNFKAGDKYYYNAVYCGNGKFLLLREPSLTLKDVTKYIPKAFKVSRYETYILNQEGQWDDRPLYILDEWVSYNNGNIVSLEDAIIGNLPSNTSDTFEASIEFTVYGICLAMAIADLDKSYLPAENDFVEFMKFNIQKSFEIYKDSQKYAPFVWDKDHKYLEEIRKGADFAPLRKFCLDKFKIDLSNWKI